ncbi:MAG: SgcJ/EcaC family oxidoreductase, partial [Planctomycetaceae bacterium]
MQSDEEQIRGVVERWLSATAAGDAETILSLMTEDVVCLLPGRGPMHREEFAAIARQPAGA